MSSPPLLGIDVASIPRVVDLVRRRPAFVQRVYTHAEARVCALRPERWATRWAAKEAVRKVAGAAGMPLPPWRSIEVITGAGGAPVARVAGWLDDVSLSLSHDAGVAVAVAAVADRPVNAPSVPGVVLPERGDGAHKGTFGTVVVVAGSLGLSGAAHLAGMAALRGGAGLSRVLVPRGVHTIVATSAPELMVQPVDDIDGGVGDVGEEAIRDALAGAAAVVVGCGLGRRPATVTTLHRLLGAVRVPVVVDADGLNIVAGGIDWTTVAAPVVVTPHPAEMARLAGATTADVQTDRRGYAMGYAADHGVVVVLKGAATVVAAPGGEVFVSPFDVVALATGGTGDVLAGLTGAMLAQGLRPFDAAVAAVTIHALAGLDVQARRGRAGAVASDILDALPGAQERLRRVHRRA